MTFILLPNTFKLFAQYDNDKFFGKLIEIYT